MPAKRQPVCGREANFRKHRAVRTQKLILSWVRVKQWWYAWAVMGVRVVCLGRGQACPSWEDRAHLFLDSFVLSDFLVDGGSC